MHGKRHGIGNVKINDETKEITYLGEFKNNRFHGKGQHKVAFFEKEASNLSTNDKFIYNGDFENGKKHGHGEMYWRPIDPEQFKDLPEADARPAEDLIIF